MSMKLKNKTVLVTGASSGIGEAVAYKVAKDGANVIITARREDKLKLVAEKIKELGGNPTIMVADISKVAEIKQLFDNIKAKFDKLDVVFNNAGLGYIGYINEMKDEEIQTIIDVNISGMILVSKYAASHMVTQNSGHIIMCSSLAGLITLPQWSVYCASKWAIVGFADSIRGELHKHNVHVSTLHPGAVKTEFFDKDKANIDISKLGNAIEVDQVADEVYKAIFTNKQKIMVPNLVKTFSTIYRFFPSLANKLIMRMVSDVKYNK
jgi:uncharacterized protein